MGRRAFVSPRSMAIGTVILLAAAASACEITVDAGPYVAHEEKRFRVSGTPSLSLDTFDGSLEVRSWDRDEILIEIEKRGPDRAQAEAIQVRAEQVGNTITIDVKRPAGRRQGFAL